MPLGVNPQLYGQLPSITTPPPMPPVGPMGGEGGGQDLSQLMAMMSQMGDGLGAASGGMGQLTPFLAGIGAQNFLAQITKFLKTITTIGTRGDKSVRVPMQANVGPMDQMAMQRLRTQQAGPPPGAMPHPGPASLPIGMPPMGPGGF